MDYLIRPAIPDDAEQIVKHMLAITAEPNNGILRSAGEYTRTPQELREILLAGNPTENALIIVAVAGDEVIGLASARGGSLQADRQTARIGIGIRAGWRDRGIGTAMMQYLITWGRENPSIHRLELSVFANNPRAIHVYEKLGFVREGVKRDACFKDGAFVDLIEMGIVFD